jgi:hypothetical protein
VRAAPAPRAHAALICSTRIDEPVEPGRTSVSPNVIRHRTVSHMKRFIAICTLSMLSSCQPPDAQFAVVNATGADIRVEITLSSTASFDRVEADLRSSQGSGPGYYGVMLFRTISLAEYQKGKPWKWNELANTRIVFEKSVRRISVVVPALHVFFIDTKSYYPGHSTLWISEYRKDHEQRYAFDIYEVQSLRISSSQGSIEYSGLQAVQAFKPTGGPFYELYVQSVPENEPTRSNRSCLY